MFRFQYKSNTSLKAIDFLVLFFGAVLSVLFVFFLGKDINFDVANYHFYNPFALLEGRLTNDSVVADLQTFFNPLLDIPTYLMAMHWQYPALIIGCIIGILQSFNIFIVYLLTKKSIPIQNNQGLWLSLLVALFTLTGTGYLWEVGTLFGDTLVSVVFLFSMYLILFPEKNLLQLIGWTLLGFAGGLKYYYFFYIIVFLGTYLITHNKYLSWRNKGAIVGALLLGGALSAGYWCLLLYTYFGNPVFPFMDNIFKSPYHGFNTVIYDLRYTPTGITDGLSMLWSLLVGGSTRFGHFVAPLSDPRIIFAWLSGIASLPLLMQGKNKIPLPIKTLILFYISSCIVWFFCFAMYRYAVIFELLSSIIIVNTYLYLWENNVKKYLLTGGILILLIALTHHQSAFPRARWDKQYIQISQSQQQEYKNCLILFGDYMGYLAPLLGKTNTYAYIEQELATISFKTKIQLTINNALQKKQNIYFVLPQHKQLQPESLSRFSLAIQDKVAIISSNISNEQYIVYSVHTTSCATKF